MTENKRFTLKGLIEGVPNICDNGEIIEQEDAIDLLNALHEENQALKKGLSELYLEKGSGEYYKQLFEEKCKECELLEQRVAWFIECIEHMGYKVVKE